MQSHTLSKSDLMRLSDASREMRVRYATLLDRVMSGAVPAERSPSGGRWMIRRADLPAIAAALGGVVAGDDARRS